MSPKNKKKNLNDLYGVKQTPYIQNQKKMAIPIYWDSHFYFIKLASENLELVREGDTCVTQKQKK